MKIPRDITGQELIKKLKPFGYDIKRQKGSHIRLYKAKAPEHYITIPDHNPIKVGTLSNILGEIAMYLNKDKKELVELLFGK